MLVDPRAQAGKLDWPSVRAAVAPSIFRNSQEPDAMPFGGIVRERPSQLARSVDVVADDPPQQRGLSRGPSNTASEANRSALVFLEYSIHPLGKLDLRRPRTKLLHHGSHQKHPGRSLSNGDAFRAGRTSPPRFRGSPRTSPRGELTRRESGSTPARLRSPGTGELPETTEA